MIRTLCMDDLPAVEELEEVTFTSKWNHEQFLYEINDNPYAVLKVLYQGDTLIGYMDYWITFECCQLNKIAIHKDYRKKGYASQLMDDLVQEAIVADCEQIMLEVRASNNAAQALYKHYNFLEVNIRKGYYQDNQEDALIMIKPLGGITL